jgi:hypothetical protein
MKSFQFSPIFREKSDFWEKKPRFLAKNLIFLGKYLLGKNGLVWKYSVFCGKI